MHCQIFALNYSRIFAHFVATEKKKNTEKIFTDFTIS